MVHMKKIIGASSVLLIAGTSIMSSVSADNENTSATGELKEQMQENRDERTQGNIEIKNERMKMNQTTQGINNIRKTGEQKVRQVQRTADSLKKQENDDNRPMMGTGQIMPLPAPLGTGELKNFLRDPLTQEEQTALKTLLQAQQAERDAILKDTTLTPETRTTKLQDLRTSHLTALLIYVSTDKQEAFKKMMDEKMTPMLKNPEPRRENRDNRQDMRSGSEDQKQEIRNQMQTKKRALSETLHKQLIRAIEKFDGEKLNKVLVNIEKAVTKITSSTLAQERKDRFLAQLAEIKTIIQDKIDTLNGTNPEENILNDVLSDTMTNTGTTTTP